MNATSTPRTQYLQLPGGTIAFDDTAGDGTPVLLLPGMLDSRREYRHLHPLLAAAGHRVITMDLRGFGESSIAWDDYTPAAIAEDAVALLDHLGIAKAVVVGHSYTGASVVKVATLVPEKVAGVVLLDAFIEQPPANVLMRGLVRVFGAALIAFPRFWGYYLNKVAMPTRKPADHAEHVAALVADLRTPGRRQATRGYALGDSAPTGWTVGFHSPALVVMGSKDPDFLNPLRVADRQATALNARKVIIDGAGHYPMSDSPQATADALLPFLAEVA
ncbi:pimeloyl-ACP methyl ester carboxylesterase [Kitasatospora sp. GAS204A]|uniref:alpha/beta fold hydrolase n=1 Tax=unclassified Kitasatospora TaxID=2633591 RepID=UPI002475665B|nr:alpha/beta hydrolase [Kitasatospora sp. GAS204B]MDH6122056.1 pimeloyl-ACP methyl ester carboxylesterase [Kitasatospora sp. GAS204B]